MDLLSLLRMLGGLGMVLGLLAGALWVVRRYDIRLPGRTGVHRVSRLGLVEKLPIDARRCIALVRRDGREHLILIAPEGHMLVESAIVRDAADIAAHDALLLRTEVPATGESFAALVEQIRDSAIPAGRRLKALFVRPGTPAPAPASRDDHDA